MADEWKYGNRVDGDEVSFNDTSYVVRKDTDQTVYDAVGSTTSDQDYTNVLSRLKALENANQSGANGYGTIEFWTREQQSADIITTSASTTVPKTRDNLVHSVSDRLTMKNGATPSAAIVSITSSNLSACSERASVSFLPPDDPGGGDLGSRLVTCWSGSNLTNSAGAAGGGTGSEVFKFSLTGVAYLSTDTTLSYWNLETLDAGKEDTTNHDNSRRHSLSEIAIQRIQGNSYVYQEGDEIFMSDIMVPEDGDSGRPVPAHHLPATIKITNNWFRLADYNRHDDPYIRFDPASGRLWLTRDKDNHRAAIQGGAYILSAQVEVVRSASANVAITSSSNNVNDILFDQVIVPVDPNTGKFTLYTSLGTSTLGEDTKIFIATTGLIGAGDSSGSGTGAVFDRESIHVVGNAVDEVGEKGDWRPTLAGVNSDRYFTLEPNITRPGYSGSTYGKLTVKEGTWLMQEDAQLTGKDAAIPPEGIILQPNDSRWLLTTYKPGSNITRWSSYRATLYRVGDSSGSGTGGGSVVS